MARSPDVARGTRTDPTHHARPRGIATRAHVWRTWHIGGADTWQGPRESTRTPEWRHVAGGLACERPTG